MISYLYAALIAVGTLVIGILLGIWIRKRAAKRAEEKISNADEEALRIVNEAIKSAENKKREGTVGGKGRDSEAPAANTRRKSRSAAPSCRSRSAGCSRRRRTSTARPTRWKRARRPWQPEACRSGQGKRRNQDHQAQPDRNARAHFRLHCRRGQGVPDRPGREPK